MNMKIEKQTLCIQLNLGQSEFQYKMKKLISCHISGITVYMYESQTHE